MKSSLLLFVAIFYCGSFLFAQADPSSRDSDPANSAIQLKRDALSREVRLLFDGLPFDSSDAVINAFCLRNGYHYDSTANGGLQYVRGGGSFDYIRGREDSVRRFNRFTFPGQKKENGGTTPGSDGKHGTLLSREMGLILRYGRNEKAAKKDFRKIVNRLKKVSPYSVYSHMNENYNGGIRNGNMICFYWYADRKHPFLQVMWHRDANLAGKSWLQIHYLKIPQG